MNINVIYTAKQVSDRLGVDLETVATYAEIYEQRTGQKLPRGERKAIQFSLHAFDVIVAAHKTANDPIACFAIGIGLMVATSTINAVTPVSNEAKASREAVQNIEITMRKFSLDFVEAMKKREEAQALEFRQVANLFGGMERIADVMGHCMKSIQRDANAFGGHVELAAKLANFLKSSFSRVTVQTNKTIVREALILSVMILSLLGNAYQFKLGMDASAYITRLETVVRQYQALQQAPLHKKSIVKLLPSRKR